MSSLADLALDPDVAPCSLTSRTSAEADAEPSCVRDRDPRRGSSQAPA
jgi:hypothetical protein